MNYPYANGIISAIENRLFDRNQYAKLYKMDKDDFIKQLLDYGYGRDGYSIEVIIESELAQLRSFLDEISPDSHLTDLFFIEADAINIKAAFKNKFFASRNVFFMTGGNITSEDLHLAVFSEDYSTLDKNYAGLIKEISSLLREIDNPQRLSTTVDKAIYRYIFKHLPLVPNLALKAYFQLSVDTKNIITMVRTQALGWEIDRFAEMFLKGGLIDFSVFMAAYSATDNILINLFKDFYQEKISIGLKRYSQNRNIDSLERYFEQLIINIMKNYRYDSFGIGPIIYYYLAKQAEANNIRLIYSGDEVIGDLTEY